MIGTSVNGIDAELLDGIDGLEHALDLGPAGKTEKNLAARSYKWHGGETFTGHDGAQDVDPRDDRAEVVRRPPDISEDAARREAQGAAPAIEDLLGDIMTEADPLLDPLLKPDQLDMGECLGRRRGHDAA